MRQRRILRSNGDRAALDVSAQSQQEIFTFIWLQVQIEYLILADELFLSAAA
jgi:hypothetical protein